MRGSRRSRPSSSPPSPVGVRIVPVTTGATEFRRLVAAVRPDDDQDRFCGVLATVDAVTTDLAAFAESLTATEISIRDGHEERVSTSVLELTRHPPRTFADCVRRPADEWRT